MARQIKKCGRNVIVYDDALISQIDATFFDAGRWPGAETTHGTGAGRGRVLFIEHDGRQWALRHYRRGGLARRLSDDEFLWFGLRRARPVREWALLERMHRAALPVPRPVAARVARHGAVYTADLVTERIPGVQTLSRRLSADALDADGWGAVGALVACFHTAGICHADLNAHNIQIDEENRLYLLDFDRGRVMDAPGAWMQKNLARLYRSLEKLRAQGVIRFDGSDWATLLEGYRQSIST